MKPKVSVWMITYNHQNYIDDALTGVIKQKTNFDWEIVISDDASTDNTPTILKRYKKKYPKLIKLFLHKKNKGMMWNMKFTLQKCSGEYVAMCEGDDYWTDKNKLEKQVNFLDNNSDYSITTHNVWILNQKTNERKQIWNEQTPQIYSFEESLIGGSGGPTCSIVFRREILPDYPNWFHKGHGGDWITQVLCLHRGYMFRFLEPMGVYRKHPGGALHAAIKVEKSKGTKDLVAIPYKYTLDNIELIDIHYNRKYNRLLNYYRCDALMRIYLQYLVNRDFKQALVYKKQLLQIKYFKPLLKTQYNKAYILLIPNFIIKILLSIKSNI